MNGLRRVVVGCYSPHHCSVNVDPTFGTDEEWAAITATVVDATPEDTDALTDDLIDGRLDEEFNRMGGA